jgi:hypothetical protein
MIVMKKVVVVIPIYKVTLDELETRSFLNNVEVLKKYDVTVIYPAGLDLSFYTEIAPDIHYRAFGKNDFSSIRSYNRLLISPRFYRAFAGYEYMLICHFDAWIFKDELTEWCDKEYDYVGAPFLEPFVGRTTAVFPFFSTVCLNKIGNGGLCLRKISTHLKITIRLRWLSFFYFYNEDVFFTLLPPFVLKRYARPSIDEALRFAVEDKAEECMKNLRGELPFGCHGWLKRDPDFWAGYIKEIDNG